MSLSFEQFQATRAQVADVAEVAGFDADDGAVFPGYIYAGGQYVCEAAPGDPAQRYRFWTFLTCEVETGSDSLLALERALFVHYGLAAATRELCALVDDMEAGRSVHPEALYCVSARTKAAAAHAG